MCSCQFGVTKKAGHCEHNFPQSSLLCYTECAYVVVVVAGYKTLYQGAQNLAFQPLG